MSQRPEGIVPRQELVDVVQQCGGLDAPAVDRRCRAAVARSASQPATSATAPTCRTNHSGGTSEHSRRAASTRPGTVMRRMVSRRDRRPWLGGPDRVRPSDRAGAPTAAGRPSGTPSGRTMPQVNGGRRASRRDRPARDRRAWPRVRHPDPLVGDPDRHAAILVGPIDARAVFPQACQRRRARDARSGSRRRRTPPRPRAVRRRGTRRSMPSRCRGGRP